MVWRYDMVLHLARAPPQVCAPSRHKHQFFSFAGKSWISAKFFQDPLCAWWVHIPAHPFGAGRPTISSILWYNFEQKKFEKFWKFLHLNPKGKWAKNHFSDFFCFWPQSRFEVCRNAINRFLRWMDLNWQVFNNFDVRHPTGPSQGEGLEKMHFLGYFF